MAGDIYEYLSEKISIEDIVRNCDMRAYTSFKAGGEAEFLIIPQNIDQLCHTLRVLSQANKKYMIIGNGSNVLVKDGGYSGAIIKLGDAFSSVETKGETLTAGAGTLLSVVAKKAMEAGLSGFEFASGIPGSIGGGVYMNAGAYSGEMAQIVEHVEILSIREYDVYTATGEELKFGYRHSLLQESGDIALSVNLRLAYGEPEKIRKRMQELMEMRNEKQPVSMPSAGSFFKRPEGYFAGKLIEDSGLKGIAVGGARVSPLHAGFIVNQGGATASDIIDLMNLVRNTVYDRFGVMLETEVKIIGD